MRTLIYPQLLVAPVPSVSHSTHMYHSMCIHYCVYNILYSLMNQIIVNRKIIVNRIKL